MAVDPSLVGLTAQVDKSRKLVSKRASKLKTALPTQPIEHRIADTADGLSLPPASADGFVVPRSRASRGEEARLSLKPHAINRTRENKTGFSM